MEWGVTHPLQRFLHMRALPYGQEENRLLCWDAHRIVLCRRDSLLLVNAHNRFAVVLYNPSPEQGRAPFAFARQGLRTALLCAGMEEMQVQQYLALAGSDVCVRTHGRREVAYLNRAWEDVMACEMLVDLWSVDQPALCHAVNARPCRCAGYAQVCSSAVHMQEDLAQQYRFLSYRPMCEDRSDGNEDGKWRS